MMCITWDVTKYLLDIKPFLSKEFIFSSKYPINTKKKKKLKIFSKGIKVTTDPRGSVKYKWGWQDKTWYKN